MPSSGEYSPEKTNGIAKSRYIDSKFKNPKAPKFSRYTF
jgi:hypothetical protein